MLHLKKSESGISSNTCESIENLENDINAGKWTKVLPIIDTFKLPTDTLCQLYEQIILELIELKEEACSQWLFEQKKIRMHMKKYRPNRYR